jgi:hypothetical protein
MVKWHDMAESGIDNRDWELIRTILLNPTASQTELAEATGLSVRTVARRTAKPEVQAALRDLQLGASQAVLHSAREALMVLERTMRDTKNELSRIRCAAILSRPLLNVSYNIFSCRSTGDSVGGSATAQFVHLPAEEIAQEYFKLLKPSQ